MRMESPAGRRVAPRWRGVRLGVVVLAATSCGDSTGPALTFAGGWVGSWEFANPAVVELSLEQAGPLVTGLFDSPVIRAGRAQLEGEIDDFGRLVWTVIANCTSSGGGIMSASGTLTMNADGERASGQAILDESTCDIPGSSSVATMTVDRERLGH